MTARTDPVVRPVLQLALDSVDVVAAAHARLGAANLDVVKVASRAWDAVLRAAGCVAYVVRRVHFEWKLAGLNTDPEVAGRRTRGGVGTQPPRRDG